MPVRDLIVRLYQAPDEIEDLVSRRRQVLTGDQEWTPLEVTPQRDMPYLDRTKEPGTTTPGFGTVTPEFGERMGLLRELAQVLGEGGVLENPSPEWPRFPMWSLTGPTYP